MKNLNDTDSNNTMEMLLDNLENQYQDSFIQDGDLAILNFPAKEEKFNILLVGGEHGDKTEGTKAILSLAQKLNENPLEQTSVDIVPVLDTNGYPNTKTTYGSSFGLMPGLDSTYLEKDAPEQVKSLRSMLDNNKYDLAVLLTEQFVDDTPILTGYFVVGQVETDIKKEDGQNSAVLNFVYGHAEDLIGTVLNKLSEAGVSTLNPKDKHLGGGYVVARPGFVMQGFKEGDNTVFRTTNPFAYVCQSRKTHSLVLNAPASKDSKGYTPEQDHAKAIEEIINFYEKPSKF